VFDGAAVALYVDGRRIDRAEGAGVRRENGLPLYVGADPDKRGDPMSFFDGQVDEVRISAGARYVGEFTPARRHAPDDETLLLLRLDQGLGPFAPDAGPGARHGVAPNGIRYAPPAGE
jgi:hypothetical protein